MPFQDVQSSLRTVPDSVVINSNLIKVSACKLAFLPFGAAGKYCSIFFVDTKTTKLRNGYTVDEDHVVGQDW